MKVAIKSFDVTMELKNKGVELEVYDTADTHKGDLIVTKTQLVWCPGRTRRENGIAVTWDEFMTWMNGRRP